MTANKVEEWRPVRGHEGYYEVSNIGRVKRLTRPVFTGRYYVTFKERILRLVKGNPNGHLYVRLSKDNIQQNRWVHRMVAEAFVPNPLNRPQVNHINNIKGDNRAENLEWVTLVENVKHSFRVLPAGMRNLKRGQDHPRAKVSSSDVARMRELSKSGMPNTEIARMYGLDTSTVFHAVKRHTWKCV